MKGVCRDFLVQMFPSHMIYFVSNIFVDPSFLERSRQIPSKQKSATCPARLHQLDMERLFAVEHSLTETALKTSGILYPDAAQGVLAARAVRKGSIVR